MSALTHCALLYTNSSREVMEYSFATTVNEEWSPAAIYLFLASTFIWVEQSNTWVYLLKNCRLPFWDKTSETRQVSFSMAGLPLVLVQILSISKWLLTGCFHGHCSRKQLVWCLQFLSRISVTGVSTGRGDLWCCSASIWETFSTSLTVMTTVFQFCTFPRQCATYWLRHHTVLSVHPQSERILSIAKMWTMHTRFLLRLPVFWCSIQPLPFKHQNPGHCAGIHAH